MEGESPTSKTFNNYIIIMTNNSDKIIMLWVWYFCLYCLFLSSFAMVIFMLFLNILKILKIPFWIFWRKNISLDLWSLFSWKPCKAFRIAHCKQPRLLKPCLNSDLYFISKTSSRVLLEKIFCYKPFPSLSQENRKTLLPASLDTSTTRQP